MKYCPVCGAKDSTEILSNLKLKCTRCTNIVTPEALLDDVDKAHRTWVIWLHGLANGYMPRPKEE